MPFTTPPGNVRTPGPDGASSGLRLKSLGVVPDGRLGPYAAASRLAALHGRCSRPMMPRRRCRRSRKSRLRYLESNVRCGPSRDASLRHQSVCSGPEAVRTSTRRRRCCASSQYLPSPRRRTSTTACDDREEDCVVGRCGARRLRIRTDVPIGCTSGASSRAPRSACGMALATRVARR